MRQRDSRCWRPLAAVIAAMLLSACSSGSTSNATSSTSPAPASPSTAAGVQVPSACRLLLPSEVQVLVGGSVRSGQGTGQACTFTNSAGHAVTVRVEGPVVGFAAEMQAYHGQAFAGAGDGAFVSKGQSFAAFVKGSTEVIVEFNSPLTGTTDVQDLEGLARDAAHRL
ncbi:MAG: hypothetical protein ACLPVY_08735 [Acidimicrobiia bacterium]